MLVEALIAHLPVEALDIGLARLDKPEIDAVAIRSGVPDLRDQLGAVVHHQHGRTAVLRTEPFEHADNAAPDSEVSTSIARHSLVKSSTMFSVRNTRPSASWPDMKSSDQHSWRATAEPKARACRPRSAFAGAAAP
jgi:hypothetical protein